MKWGISLTGFLLLSTSALAQQQQPPVQEQIYTACGNTNIQLAKMLDMANTQIEGLKRQIESLTVRPKTEPEKKP